jgi:hypothetical protein
MGEIELGQILFSNTPAQEFEADWASNGLEAIADVVSEFREITDPWNRLTSNSGGEPFENETFLMNAYCWCDGEGKGHENGCPPNFLYKPANLVISWYKHAERGIRANVEELKAKDWHNIVHACIESIR